MGWNALCCGRIDLVEGSIHRRQRGTRQMRVRHDVTAVFDKANLVSCVACADPGAAMAGGFAPVSHRARAPGWGGGQRAPEVPRVVGGHGRLSGLHRRHDVAAPRRRRSSAPSPMSGPTLATPSATAPLTRPSPRLRVTSRSRSPKVRSGSLFPALLAPRRRIDVALHGVVMQAYVEGVSTRRVDAIVIAMGGTGISKSEGSSPRTRRPRR